MSPPEGDGARAAERIGVLGGTFDPVHVAHVVAAVEVRHALQLDRMLLVVAGEPWQKAGTVAAPAADRLAMVGAVCDEVPGLEVSDVEVRRRGPSYTADTLVALAAPGRVLFLVVGSDVAADLHTWERVDEVRAAATLVVVDRAGAEPTRLRDDAWSIEHVSIPALDVSSTDLRRRLEQGRPVDGLVPPGAVRVIRERRLYTPAR